MNFYLKIHKILLISRVHDYILLEVDNIILSEKTNDMNRQLGLLYN